MSNMGSCPYCFCVVHKENYPKHEEYHKTKGDILEVFKKWNSTVGEKT